MNMQALFMNYGPQLLTCDSADFDGTNDRLERGGGLTGAADSKSGIVSLWVRFDGGDGSEQRIIYTTTNQQWIRKNSTTNLLSVVFRNSGTSIILSLTSATSYTASATWLHILASWDLSVGAGHLYVNDVDDLAVSPTLTDDTIDYTVTNWAIGSEPGGFSGPLNGCLAEVYFASGQYLDFSNVYQRRKFISSSGKPVYLGADGSAPTGTAPIVYQRVADGAAVATFATNLGTGGNFSITGTLETGSTSPSD